MKAPAWASFVLSLVVWSTGLAYLFLRPWQPASPVAWAILAGLGAVVIHWFGGSGSILGLIQDLNALAQAVSSQATANPTTAPVVQQPAASPASSVSSSPPAPSPQPYAPLASGTQASTSGVN